MLLVNNYYIFLNCI